MNDYLSLWAVPSPWRPTARTLTAEDMELLLLNRHRWEPDPEAAMGSYATRCGRCHEAWPCLSAQAGVRLRDLRREYESRESRGTGVVPL